MQAYFIARQPILDSAGQTIAYELLFRSGDTNAYDPAVDGDSATSQILINAMTEMGIDQIAGRHRAFINLTRHFIENPELLNFLPADRVVLEILETVEITPDVLRGVQTLKQQGYTIALDDFIMRDEFTQLLPLIDIIKFDITQYDNQELVDIASRRKSPQPQLLVERVETRDEFELFRDAGFDLFQGYYFAKPKVLSGTKIPADKGTLLQLLTRLNDSSVTFEEITEIMSHDVSLGVRALKFVNSPISGLHNRVTSIHQAAVLLGRDTIRNWVMLLMMAGIDEKPLELVKMALIRARFCQLTGKQEHIDEDGCMFTVGLFSLLDAMMDLDMSDVLDRISATDELRAILQHKQGRASELIDIVCYLESPLTAWPKLEIDVSETMSKNYLDSIAWAEETTGLLAA